MRPGESLLDQKRRKSLSALARSAASVLQEEWEKIDDDAPAQRFVRPALLARLARICRNQQMSRIALGHILVAEATNARLSPIPYLEWLIRELELSLAPFASGVYRYVRLNRESLSPERSVGLVYLAVSFSPEPKDRGTLLELLTCIVAHGSTLRLVPPPPSSKSEFITAEQQHVLSRLLELADTYFSNQQLGSIRPRLFPVVVGPSGAGKTFLGKRVAGLVKAEYVCFTCADWIPLGANQEYEPTLYAILIKLANHERIVLCIDEIDKVRLDAESSWGKSVCLDLLRVLDLNFPIAGFLKSTRASSEAVGVTKEELASKIARNLWIMGCGAWQALHEKKAQLGFFPEVVTAKIDARVIQHTATIPPELLLRFHPEILQVRYPTPEETADLFNACGLTEAAASLGMDLDPASHDWTRGGLRTLEAIWGEVAVRKRKRQIDIIQNG
jgi:hypothetical protein